MPSFKAKAPHPIPSHPQAPHSLGEVFTLPGLTPPLPPPPPGPSTDEVGWVRSSQVLPGCGVPSAPPALPEGGWWVCKIKWEKQFCTKGSIKRVCKGAALAPISVGLGWGVEGGGRQGCHLPLAAPVPGSGGTLAWTLPMVLYPWGAPPSPQSHLHWTLTLAYTLP